VAKVIGTSQAWSHIVETLASRNLTVNKIEDIQQLLKQKSSEYEKEKEEAIKNFECELEQTIRNFNETKASFQSTLESLKKESDSQIELIEIAIQILEDERRFIKRIINKSRIREYRKQIHNIKARHNRYFQNLQASIIDKQKDIEFRKSNRGKTIEDQCQKTKGDINYIEQALSSPFRAGAAAELELIELLSKLPESFYIINDVELVLKNGIQFDGEWLQSAQIDHLIVSPAGVFVIETKNWSKEFSEYGDYFDPYQQVKRSSYLCYKLLQNKFGGTKVRSIIAYKGTIPNKPDDSNAKVLQFNKVNSYILSFKEKVFSDDQIKEIAKCIKQNF